MTLQIAHQKCNDCKFYSNTTLYELCLHARSAYIYEHQDFHTIQHMRSEQNPCGTQAILFVRK